MLKKNIKMILRYLLKINKNETIKDGIQYKIVRIEKKINKKKVEKVELYNAIKKMGIKEGDTIMVHCSWRKFYSFNGTPEDLIEMLIDIIGEDGTLIMPSYGRDKFIFDVDNTPSEAGVLSEVFRKMPNTFRSKCSHFSVCILGNKASEIIDSHFNSEYGFDYNSPCYKMTQYENSKILLLGLGKNPTKISVFHCAGYILKDKDKILNNILSFRYKSKLIIDGETYDKEMLTRQPQYRNDNKVFKKIFKNINNKKQMKLSNIDLVVINAKEALDNAILFAKKGEYCYKKVNK